MANILILSREEFAPLVALLAEVGHQVVEAYDSGHVFQLVMRRQFDAVIIPEDAEPMDGEELLPVVRRLTRAAIVVAGERADETMMATALFQGADAYLRFPDDPTRVRSRLRSILRRAPRPAREARENGGRESNGKKPGAEQLFRHLAPEPA